MNKVHTEQVNQPNWRRQVTEVLQLGLLWDRQWNLQRLYLCCKLEATLLWEENFLNYQHFFMIFSKFITKLCNLLKNIKIVVFETSYSLDGWTSREMMPQLLSRKRFFNHLKLNSSKSQVHVWDKNLCESKIVTNSRNVT